jgi:hypothetical protein
VLRISVNSKFTTHLEGNYRHGREDGCAGNDGNRRPVGYRERNGAPTGIGGSNIVDASVLMRGNGPLTRPRAEVFTTLSILVFNFYPVTAAMLVLLALLDDGPILAIAYDRVRYRNAPES